MKVEDTYTHQDKTALLAYMYKAWLEVVNSLEEVPREGWSNIDDSDYIPVFVIYNQEVQA